MVARAVEAEGERTEQAAGWSRTCGRAGSGIIALVERAKTKHGASERQWLPLALAVARGAMAAFFLNEAATQLRKGWVGGDGLEKMLRSALRDNALLPPYRYFLEDAVLRHADLFTVIVLVGEIAVGAALVLGLATRLTAIVALSMNIAFLLMNSVTFGGLIDAVFVALEIVLIAFAGRQAWSVDRALATRGVTSWWMSGEVRERRGVRSRSG